MTIAVAAITKHGISIARKIKEMMPEVDIYAPAKHADSDAIEVNYFAEQTTQKIAKLFKSYDALVCIFSLGATIRIIAPLLADKKSDPAVLVIDDKANFVISTLSGHIGGANELTQKIASFFPNSQAVITTAADVNKTISVDLLGKEFGWVIENYENVTKVSAFMVNEEPIAVYQETGEKNRWLTQTVPKNVTVVKSLNEVKSPTFKGALIISDRVINDRAVLEKSVIYRPKSLVLGIGLHWDTSKDMIEYGVMTTLKNKELSLKSIRNISSISNKTGIKALRDFSDQHQIPLEFFDRDQLSLIKVPNPSPTVEKYEGTASVSEASAILSSKGEIVVPKEKFTPNLTMAVARVKFE
jgi:cobalt-precorrin 5A hydrolase